MSDIAQRINWQEKLDGAPQSLSLPWDQPRAGSIDQWTAQHAHITKLLPSLEREGAGELAESTGSPVYSVLLAAWLVLIYRYTDESDLVLGCAGVGASPNGSDLYVIRGEVLASQSFRTVLQRTEHELASMVAVGPTTVSGLLDELRVEPGSGRHPIFQLAFQKTTEEDSPTHESGTFRFNGARCDVVLAYEDVEEGLQCMFWYTPALFSAAHISRLAGHFETLLAAALADPDCSVGDLPLLTAVETAQLGEWNATERVSVADLSLVDLYHDRTQHAPDAIALEFGDDVLTFAQLNAHADVLAHALQSRGVAAGVPVAISMDRSIELAIAILGVLKAGGGYVPLDASYPESRRAYMLQNSGATILLSRVGERPVLPEGHEIDVLVVDASEKIEDLRIDRELESDASGESLGYVVYTSGSTGQPKGIAMPQGALANLISWQVDRHGFNSGARTLQFSSISFDVSFQEIFATWCSGGSVVMVSDTVRRDPRGLLDYLIRHDIERIFLPFVALRGLADAATSSGRYPVKLREIYTAGEQLQVDATIRSFFDAIPECLLENQYGPAETHVATAFRLQGDARTWPALPSIGSPVTNAKVHVLDERRVRRPVGVPGELYLGGRCLADGYIGRPDLTAERFVRQSVGQDTEQLYRTGDLGRWLGDGTIEFLGRSDDQVKFRGFRIEPGEIGAVLASFPGVRQSVAMPVDIEGLGPRLAAYVLPAEDTELSLSDLHRHVSNSLPDYMVPSHFTVVESFPLTPSGKIDRKALPAPTFDRRILLVSHEPPRTDDERQLAQMWEQLLGIEDIGVHDDFYELGGDSLLAVELFARIAETFGTELPLGSLAAQPTIAGLSSLVSADNVSQQWNALVPLRTEGSGTPVFCIHGGSGNVASFPQLARELSSDRPVYALQWDGLDGHGGAQSIEEMAQTYIDEIRLVAPHGPYIFAGHCIGGLIAREMARTLLTEGEAVPLIVMYDTPNLYSSAFRLGSSIPSLPNLLQRPANRLVGLGGNTARFILGKRPRRQYVRVRVQALLRGGVSHPDDREAYVQKVMVPAAWRYRVQPLTGVQTLLIHSGRPSGVGIALAGQWTDGVMGWSDEVSDNFEAHLVKGSHNGLPYERDSVRLLRAALPA